MTQKEQDILLRLSSTLQEKKQADPTQSYTAKLLSNGLNGILKKIGEESTELVVAAKDGENDRVVEESADVVYHMMVLLTYCGLSIESVLQELARREGISGIEEKNARG